MTAPLDPDRFPDVRPDRTRFWTLRVLAWTFVAAGLIGLGFGLAHGLLAYYATKNGAELERIVTAGSWFGACMAGGLVAIVIGQIVRVLLAIEENTRLIAFHTRPRARHVEQAAERRVANTERVRP